jgi:hypothetical protein
MTSFHGNQTVEKYRQLISNIPPKNKSRSVLPYEIGARHDRRLS